MNEHSWGFTRAQTQYDAEVPRHLEEGYGDLDDDFDGPDPDLARDQEMEEEFMR